MTYLLVVDIGSSQISAAVAEITKERGIIVRGQSCARSGGLKQGVVIQIDSVVEAVSRAVAEANQMAGTKLSNPLVSIGGAHLVGQDVVGLVDLNKREVTDTMLTQAMEQVQAQATVADREILSVIPRSFTLDNQTGIRSPQGMTGNRLEVNVHVITGATHVVRNLKKCLHLAGLDTNILVPSALAVSQLVSSDERELGVCIADIGSGTTDLILLSEGAPAWMQVVPMGGELLTHDLAVALKTPLGDAEKLKIQHGYAHTSFAPVVDGVQVRKIADRPSEMISLQQLTAFLQPRVEEIAEILGERLRHSGWFEEISTGLVLSGGSAGLPGIADVFESILQCPCRVLKGDHLEGLDALLKDPANAVLAGLLVYGRDQELRPGQNWLRAQKGILKRIRRWVQRNF
jgi:cell division protein FtsA